MLQRRAVLYAAAVSNRRCPLGDSASTRTPNVEQTHIRRSSNDRLSKRGGTMTRFVGVVALGVLVASPVSAQKPQIQWDKDFDFSTVKAFQWQPPSSPSLAESDPIMHKFIEAAIETELQKAGLTETTGDPDVYVTYHGSVDTEVQLRSTSFGYGVGSYGMGGWGASGYSVGTQHTTTREVQTKKGTLIVDIVDAKEKQL